MTEKLYCFALYIWLYWFILHILGGGDVKQNFRDSCPKWLCYLDLVPSTQSGPCFVIFFGISRVYHLWSITLVFQKRSREKDWALDLEMKLVICNKNRRKSLPLTVAVVCSRVSTAQNSTKISVISDGWKPGFCSGLS